MKSRLRPVGRYQLHFKSFSAIRMYEMFFFLLTRFKCKGPRAAVLSSSSLTGSGFRSVYDADHYTTAGRHSVFFCCWTLLFVG